MPSRIHSTRICTFSQFPRIGGVGVYAVAHQEWERKSIPANGHQQSFLSEMNSAVVHSPGQVAALRFEAAAER